MEEYYKKLKETRIVNTLSMATKEDLKDEFQENVGV